MSMISSETAEVKASIRDFLNNSVLPLAREGSFEDDDSFLEKGLLDSTGVLELVGFVENRFSIRFEADEITPENLDSLDKIAAFINRKMAPGVRSE